MHVLFGSDDYIVVSAQCKLETVRFRYIFDAAEQCCIIINIIINRLTWVIQVEELSQYKY